MLRTSELSGLEAGRVSRMSQDLPGGKIKMPMTTSSIRVNKKMPVIAKKNKTIMEGTKDAGHCQEKNNYARNEEPFEK
jgi:hypothetical protein